MNVDGRLDTGVIRGHARGVDTRLLKLEEKRRIGEETPVEGVSVAEIARRHGLKANLVFNGRNRIVQDSWAVGAEPNDCRCTWHPKVFR